MIEGPTTPKPTHPFPVPKLQRRKKGTVWKPDLRRQKALELNAATVGKPPRLRSIILNHHWLFSLAGLMRDIYYFPGAAQRFSRIYNLWLVGGFNPSEKYQSKWVHLPQFSGWKKKIREKPPPSWEFIPHQLWEFFVYSRMAKCRTLCLLGPKLGWFRFCVSGWKFLETIQRSKNWITWGPTKIRSDRNLGRFFFVK